ncbi:MAG: FecR family protein, partial [Betaproteobacteria bacterium]|nr:FecR family protein [Betaproteobacteria bacterium]
MGMIQMFVLNLIKSNTLVTASVGSVFLILLGFTDKAYATESCESPVAKIVSVQGVIEIRSANETAWRAAAMNTMLCTGDMIRAGSHSNAALRLSNESMLRLDQRTTITFPQSEQDKATSLLDLLRGAIHIITRTPKPFKVRTPFVNALVEGTEFFV